MVHIEFTDGKVISVENSTFPRLQTSETVKVPFPRKIWKRIDQLTPEVLEARAFLGSPYRFGFDEDRDEEVAGFLKVVRHEYFPARSLLAKWWPLCVEAKSVVISSTENGTEDSILLDLAFDSSVEEYILEDEDPPLLFAQKRDLKSVRGKIHPDFLKALLCTNPTLMVNEEETKREITTEERRLARTGKIPVPCPDELLLILPQTYYSEYAKYPSVRYSLVCLGLIRADPSTYMLITDEKRIVWEGNSRGLLLALYRNQETLRSVQGLLEDCSEDCLKVLRSLRVITDLVIEAQDPNLVKRYFPEMEQEEHLCRI